MKLASPIHLLERDFHLNLNAPRWPPPDLKILSATTAESDSKTKWLASAWEPRPSGDLADGSLLRKLCRKAYNRDGSDQLLYESILRLPSAPLFGIQHKHDYQVGLVPIHRHTVRLLTTDEPAQNTSITKVYIFLNGLNEIDHFGFYYDLAARLIQSEPKNKVACLVHPYPAHLTRYPLIGHYAEKPLQRFIVDPSDLFRQYLRFMIETQWLLSMLVPVSYYPVAPGTRLLAEDAEPLGGRCNSEFLSRELETSWTRLFECSLSLVEEAGSNRNPGEVLSASGILSSIAAIRHAFGWNATNKRLTDYKLGEQLPPPGIHMVGYSLGGYLAQSAFFAWPFAISSCTTLCSGAALHDLRPIRIVHEEEWKSIAHGLKFAIESGMLEGRMRITGRTDSESHAICGIPSLAFSSYYEIFVDVFLRDPLGSYRARVTEFGPRLFFIVGGNDPIVSAQSVIEASPAEGINMMEIANLSHFIALASGEWETFWMPAVAGIISSFSGRSQTLLALSILSNLWEEETVGPAHGKWPEEEHAPSSNRAGAERRSSLPLDSRSMQIALDEVVSPLQERGFLFILRNQIPFTLMGRRVLHSVGGSPHYADFQIRKFWQRLQDLQGAMRSDCSRLTILLPEKLNMWFVQEPPVLAVKSLPFAREYGVVATLERIWTDFIEAWRESGALFWFDPDPLMPLGDDRFELERLIRGDTSTPARHPILNCLPDVWIGFSKAGAAELAGGAAERKGVQAAFSGLILEMYKQSGRGQGWRSDALEKIERWLASGDLRILRISMAQSNPHFLGERIYDFDTAFNLLVHASLSLARAQPCNKKGEFARD